MADRRGCVSDLFIHKSYRGGIKMKNVYFCMLTNNMGSKLKMADRRGCVSDFVIHKCYRGGIKMKNVYFCKVTNNMGSKITNG
jgi:hypothetical protein